MRERIYKNDKVFVFFFDQVVDRHMLLNLTMDSFVMSCLLDLNNLERILNRDQIRVNKRLGKEGKTGV